MKVVISGKIMSEIVDIFGDGKEMMMSLDNFHIWSLNKEYEMVEIVNKDQKDWRVLGFNKVYEIKVKKVKKERRGK